MMTFTPPKNILFLCFFIGFSFGLLPLQTATAQQKENTMAYLKSGSVLIGKVIESDPEKGITLQNDCGLWLIRPGELDSLVLSPTPVNTQSPGRSFYNHTSFALLFGEGQNGKEPYTSITSVSGIQWNERLFAGAGIGFDHLEWSTFPLFAQLAYVLFQGPVAPFVSAKIGYAFPLEKYDNANYYGPGKSKTYGGIMLSPEAGVKIRLSNRSAFLCSLGYAYQEMSYNEVQNIWDSSYGKRVYTHINRVSLRIGFTFN